MTNEKSDTPLTDALVNSDDWNKVTEWLGRELGKMARISWLHEHACFLERKLAKSAAQPSGASLRCLRCGEKQDVVFKFAAESAQAPNSDGVERDVLKTQNDSMREYLRTIQDSTYRNAATLRGIAHDALQANPPLLSERNER